MLNELPSHDFLRVMRAADRCEIARDVCELERGMLGHSLLMGDLRDAWPIQVVGAVEPTPAMWEGMRVLTALPSIERRYG